MSKLPTRPASRILRAAEADLWIDGYAFMQAARDEAERVRDDTAHWLQEAREEGFAAARREADEQMIERLASVASQVDAYLAGIEPALVDLVLGVVRQVMGHLSKPEVLLDCTRNALLAFRRDQQLTLFVPSLEVAAVRDRLNLDPIGRPVLFVEADEELAPGQACLSGEVGSVEVGLEEQLQHIRRSLLPFAEERAS
ncbi:FliH/SctL family protein [Pseudomonas fluorescens]|uniref:Type III secretion protein n=1 Tax=Pseudomonas fluorescens TaxID=294 RepID=A0A0F4V7U9_PSEFL|nr:FliH/SctL family protein [Pseudomonas fluorescens]KJZ64570.1 type III secretion protein [Pseudomonas fluorescens]